MIRFWYLLLLLLLPVIASAQVVSPDSLHKKKGILPGTTTSVSFVIKNTSPQKRSYRVVMTSSSPSSIIPISTQKKIYIPPKSRFLYLVPIRVSSGAREGTYSITLKLLGPKGEEEIIRSTSIRVAELKKIKLARITAPNYINAGQTIKSSFILANRGNTTERFSLTSNAHITGNIRHLKMKPGDSKVIDVRQTTSPGLKGNDIFMIRLSAISTVDSTKRWNAYTSTTVIATHPAKKDPYFRYPITASLGYIGMRNRGRYQGGLQAEIFGQGSLTKQGDGQLKFHIVTPNPTRFTSFSKYERYSASYKNDHLYAHLGDKAFSASYLTDYNRFGRGAAFRYTFNDTLTVGGFYNHPRLYGGIENEFNLFSSLKLKKQTKLTVGYLYKTPDKSYEGFGQTAFRPKEPTNLPYVVVTSQPVKNLNILAGGAYSKTNHANGYAYRLRGNGHFKRVSGGFQYLHAGPKFNGYFNNSTSINANVRYQPLKNVFLFGNYGQSARNMRHDTLFLSAPYRKSYYIGAGYQYLKGGRVSLYAGKRRYEDRMEPKHFNYKEKFIRLHAKQKIGFFNLNLEGQFGRTTNFLTGLTGNSEYYTANLGFQQFKTSFNLYGSYARTFRYKLENQKQFYYGARIRSRFSKNSYLSLFYRNSYRPEDIYKNRNLFQLIYHQQLFPKGAIELSGRYALQQGQIGNKDFLFSLRFIVNINAPVQKVAEYTTLSGTIRNKGVTQVGGIRLRLGSHVTTTDSRGHYTFKNVLPGRYLLRMARGGTALASIPTIELPASLIITKHKNVFSFGLTTAATIKGKVQVELKGKQNKVSKLLRDTKKEHNHIIVEATNGKQTYRKLCTLNASFNFTYLRPGNWTLKVYRNGLDKSYEVLTKILKFSLAPSKIQKVHIKVAKKQMNIEYQKQGIDVNYKR